MFTTAHVPLACHQGRESLPAHLLNLECRLLSLLIKLVAYVLEHGRRQHCICVASDSDHVDIASPLSAMMTFGGALHLAGLHLLAEEVLQTAACCQCRHHASRASTAMYACLDQVHICSPAGALPLARYFGATFAGVKSSVAIVRPQSCGQSTLCMRAVRVFKLCAVDGAE
jgi:hypothetical protein